MSINSKTFKDPDFQKVEIALRRAAAAARKLSRQTNTPFIVWQDGKILDLNAPKPRNPRSRKTNPPAPGSDSDPR